MAESKTVMAVATATTLGTPDTPIEQAKKEIDEELGQEGSIEDLDFAGNYMGSLGAKYLATKLGKMTKTIELDLRVNNIDDEGIGIPKEERNRVFNKFYRVGTEETRKTKGTGLGLYIVHHFVKAHGGSVQIQSNIPKGTRFTVRIPRS